MSSYNKQILISDKAKEKLDSLKIHPNQAYGEIIDKLLGINKDILIKGEKR